MTQTTLQLIYRPERAAQMKRRAWLLIVLGGFFLVEVIFLIGVILSEGTSSAREGFFIFLYLLLPFLLLTIPFFRGLYALFAIRKARQAAEFLAADDDSMIPFDTFVQAMHASPNALRRRLAYQLRKGLLANVQYDEELDLITVSRQGTFWQAPVYLDVTKVRQNRYASRLWLVFGLFGLWFISVVLTMDSTTVGVILSGGLPVIALLAYSLHLHHRIRRLEACNRLFEACSDDELPLDETADRVPCKKHILIRDLEWGLRQGCLRYCYVDHDSSQIVLADVQDGSAQFAAVACTHCGSTARIRVGRIGKCPHCGTLLAAPKLASLYNAGIPKHLLGNPSLFQDEKRLQLFPWLMLIPYGLAGTFAIALATMLFSSPAQFRTWLSEAPFAFILACAIIAAGAALGSFLSQGPRLTASMAHLFPITDDQRIPASVLAAKIGTREGTLRLWLPFLLRTGCLTGCRFADDEIEITEPIHRSLGFTSGPCPHCGATLRRKSGTVALCRYCGSFLDPSGNASPRAGKPHIVVLHDPGEHSETILGYLKTLTGMPLRELMDIMEHLPAEVANTTPPGAAHISADLKRLGASVEVITGS